MTLIRTLAAAALLCVASASANATLLGRDLNGSPGSFEAYYDTVLDITWLANANLAQTNQFGVAGINLANGRMEWATAVSWVAAMNASNGGLGYLGINTWRLPKMFDIGNDGCTVNSFSSYDGGDCGYNVESTGSQASEVASLFYSTLGNNAAYTTSGALCTTYSAPCPRWQNTGVFSNLGTSNFYWYGDSTTTDGSGIDYGVPVFAWYFGPSGAQRPNDQEGNFYNAWAVFDGDIQAVVPVPGAVWLLGSALGVLGWVRRKS